MKLTEDQYAEVYRIMTKRVEEMAESVASWVDIDDSNAQRIITGIEDGDPEILDSFPCVDWSGQWADGPDWKNELQSVVSEVIGEDTEANIFDFEDLFHELGQDHANSVVQTEIERRANLYL